MNLGIQADPESKTQNEKTLELDFSTLFAPNNSNHVLINQNLLLEFLWCWARFLISYLDTYLRVILSKNGDGIPVAPLIYELKEMTVLIPKRVLEIIIAGFEIFKTNQTYQTIRLIEPRLEEQSWSDEFSAWDKWRAQIRQQQIQQSQTYKKSNQKQTKTHWHCDNRKQL